MEKDLRGNQATIETMVSLSGIGVHSGQKVSMTFMPADADTGIVFHRTTPDGTVHEHRAISSQVGSTALCTVLGQSLTTCVATIEHLMAALNGLGIDNLIIEIDGAEVPIMDGSAADFVEVLDQAGRKVLDAKRHYIRVTRPVRVELGGSWAEFVPHDGTRFEIDIDFDCAAIGRQSWKGEISADTFRRELANARTFGFMRDVEQLWAAGYALGSSLENSIVIGDDDTVINVGGLRRPDEFVRHKTLDALGDLALAGAQFIGCYRSYRGGHRLNAAALNALLADTSAYEIVETATQSPRSARHGELRTVSAPAFAPWAL